MCACVAAWCGRVYYRKMCNFIKSPVCLPTTLKGLSLPHCGQKVTQRQIYRATENGPFGLLYSVEGGRQDTRQTVYGCVFVCVCVTLCGSSFFFCNASVSEQESYFDGRRILTRTLWLRRKRASAARNCRVIFVNERAPSSRKQRNHCPSVAFVIGGGKWASLFECRRRMWFAHRNSHLSVQCFGWYGWFLERLKVTL